MAAYVRSLPITPLLDTKEVAQLTCDEQSLARYLTCNLFEEKKIEAKKTGKRFTYYVKIFGKNPDSTVLSNLADEAVKLKPASEGRLRGDIVYDPETDFAEEYSIISISFTGEEAKAQVDFYHAALWGIGYEYRLARKGTTWEIKKAKWLWIS